MSAGVLGPRQAVLAEFSRLDGLRYGALGAPLAFAALPTASSAYVLAARMGYDGPYVAGLVTLSTLLGMASLPFALGLMP